MKRSLRRRVAHWTDSTVGEPSEGVENVGAAAIRRFSTTRFPAMDLEGGAGRLRVIAGSFLAA